MKIKYIFLAISMFVIQFSFGQVGIDTDTPDESSILDINSTKRGLRMPSVALTGRNDITTIPNPGDGLMVFNSADAQLNTDNQVLKNNYYYFDKPNNRWQQILTDETLSLILDETSVPSLGMYIYRSARQKFSNWGIDPYYQIEFAIQGNGINCKDGDFSIVNDPTECQIRSDQGESMSIDIDKSEFIVEKTGVFQISSFITMLLSRGPATGPRFDTFYNIAFQKKASVSAAWEAPSTSNLVFVAPCVYFEQDYDNYNLTQSCTFTDVAELKAGEVVRMLMIYKDGPVISNPAKSGTEYSFFLGVPFSVGFSMIYYKQQDI